MVTDLSEVVEELFGHVEQEPVLAESRREARVHLEYLVDELVSLAARVSLE